MTDWSLRFLDVATEVGKISLFIWVCCDSGSLLKVCLCFKMYPQWVDEYLTPIVFGQWTLG